MRDSEDGRTIARRVEPSSGKRSFPMQRTTAAMPMCRWTYGCRRCGLRLAKRACSRPISAPTAFTSAIARRRLCCALRGTAASAHAQELAAHYPLLATLGWNEAEAT